MLLRERLEPFYPIDQLSDGCEGPTVCPAPSMWIKHISNQLGALSLSSRTSVSGLAQTAMKR